MCFYVLISVKQKKNNFLSAHIIKMSLQKTKFGDKKVDKKEFYSSKFILF